MSEPFFQNHVCRDTVNDGGKPSRNAESLADVESTRGAIGQVTVLNFSYSIKCRLNR